MIQPFFSVIIPTFNRDSFLEKCVTSVTEQNYENFEIIIVDDGSTDGTRKIIKSLTDDRIKYHYTANHGPAYARNRGIEKAGGDYMAFLDSDDWWKNKKLEKIVEYINNFPDIKIFHTEEIWYKNGKLLNQKEKHKKPEGFVYEKSLSICCISISTAVIHNDVFRDIGLFDESLEACEDYDFWLRATSKFAVKLIPEELTLKDGGRPDQLSSRVWGLDRFRIKALEKMLRSGILPPDMYDITLQELKKKCEIFSSGCAKRGKFAEAEWYRDLPGKYLLNNRTIEH